MIFILGGVECLMACAQFSVPQSAKMTCPSRAHTPKSVYIGALSIAALCVSCADARAPHANRTFMRDFVYRFEIDGNIDDAGGAIDFISI